MDKLTIKRSDHDIERNGAVEASCLGIPPGEWPHTIIVDDKEFGSPYTLRDSNCEVTGLQYEAADGEKLTVLND